MKVMDAPFKFISSPLFYAKVSNMTIFFLLPVWLTSSSVPQSVSESLSHCVMEGQFIVSLSQCVPQGGRRGFLFSRRTWCGERNDRGGHRGISGSLIMYGFYVVLKWIYVLFIPNLFTKNAWIWSVIPLKYSLSVRGLYCHPWIRR